MISQVEANSNEKPSGAKQHKTVVASGRGYSWRVATKSVNPASPASQNLNFSGLAESAQQAFESSTDQNKNYDCDGNHIGASKQANFIVFQDGTATTATAKVIRTP